MWMNKAAGRGSPSVTWTGREAKDTLGFDEPSHAS